MPLIYKLGTTQLLKVGTDLAGSTACCCAAATGRCCHYEPQDPPVASGSVIDPASWALPSTSVATCTDGVAATSCNGVFSAGASCTSFNCNTSDTSTLAAGNCWLWRQNTSILQISTNANYVKNDYSFCTTCSTLLPCVGVDYSCVVVELLYSYLENTYYSISFTQPAANVDTTTVVPRDICGGGQVASNAITKQKSTWQKIGQIPCTGTVRDTILAQLQTYTREYNYDEIFNAGIPCGLSPLGKFNIVDTLTYAHPTITGNTGCTC